MTPRFPQRTLRRLASAEGYLELGMPEHALRELDKIEQPGQLAAACDFLAGQAWMELECYARAAERLQRAAETFPVLQSQYAWELLSECFTQCGADDLAEVAEVAATTVDEIRTRVQNELGAFQHVAVQAGPFSFIAEVLGLVPSRTGWKAEHN